VKKSPLNSIYVSGVLIFYTFFFQFNPLIASAVDSLLLHDWQADVILAENSKKQCYIQFSGINKEKRLISMRLAMVEETSSSKGTRTWTLIKVSAGAMLSHDPTDLFPLKIEEAWLETSTGSSLGLIKKVDQEQAFYFLGGSKGFSLFEVLLKGIGEDGITLGFRTKSELKVTVLHVPAPPRSLFLKLYGC